MMQARRKILKILSKVVLSKVKFEQLFMMTKKQMMKQKSIIIFIVFFNYLYKETLSFSSNNLETYLNKILEKRKK